MCWPQQEWVDSSAVSLVNRLARGQRREKLSPEGSCPLQRKPYCSGNANSGPIAFDCRDKHGVENRVLCKKDWGVIPAQLRVYIMRVTRTFVPGDRRKPGVKRAASLHNEYSRAHGRGQEGAYRVNANRDPSLLNSPLSPDVCPVPKAGTLTDTPCSWQDPQARSWKFILLNVCDIIPRQWVTLRCQILNAETGDGRRKTNRSVVWIGCGRPLF